MVEYIIIIAGIALAVLAAVKFLGTAVGSGYDTMSGAMTVVADGIEAGGTSPSGASTPFLTNKSGAPKSGDGRSLTCIGGRHNYGSGGPGMPESCRDCGVTSS